MPLLVVDTQLVDVTQTTTKSICEKAPKTQQSSKNQLNRAENSEDSGGVTACQKNYKSQSMCITFVIIQACERTWFSMINLTYSSLFWDTGLQAWM